MVGEAWSEPVEKVVLHYLKGNVVHEYRLEERDVVLARDRAYDIALRVRADSRLAPRLSPLCRFCGFLEECPERAQIRERYLEPAAEPDESEGSLPF